MRYFFANECLQGMYSLCYTLLWYSINKDHPEDAPRQTVRNALYVFLYLRTLSLQLLYLPTLGIVYAPVPLLIQPYYGFRHRKAAAVVHNHVIVRQFLTQAIQLVPQFPDLHSFALILFQLLSCHLTPPPDLFLLPGFL